MVGIVFFATEATARVRFEPPLPPLPLFPSPVSPPPVGGARARAKAFSRAPTLWACAGGGALSEGRAPPARRTFFCLPPHPTPADPSRSHHITHRHTLWCWRAGPQHMPPAFVLRGRARTTARVRARVRANFCATTPARRRRRLRAAAHRRMTPTPHYTHARKSTQQQPATASSSQQQQQHSPPAAAAAADKGRTKARGPPSAAPAPNPYPQFSHTSERAAACAVPSTPQLPTLPFSPKPPFASRKSPRAPHLPHMHPHHTHTNKNVPPWFFAPQCFCSACALPALRPRRVASFLPLSLTS